MIKKRLVLCLIAMAFLVSCSNTNHEARIKKLEEIIFELDSTNKAQETEKNALNQKKEEVEKKRVSESLNFDKKFVGRWKFHSMNPPASDNTMSGIICNLEKYSNTQGTYVFHLYTGNDLILSKKDENTLIGENANMFVRLNPNTKLLTLTIPDGSSWTFKKLQ